MDILQLFEVENHMTNTGMDAEEKNNRLSNDKIGRYLYRN